MLLNELGKKALPTVIYSPLARAAKVALMAIALYRCNVEDKYLVRLVNSLNGVVPRLCPICGFRGLFSAFGDPPKWDERCPRCFSLGRHRLLYLFLSDRALDLENSKILHFAPERCLEPWLRSRCKNYQTADLSSKRSDLELNIESTDLPDELFDVILCNHVLEHVDDRAALKEVRRILKPNGVLLVTIPIIEGWKTTYENPAISDEEGRWAHFGKTDHIRYFGADFRRRVQSANFNLDEYTAFGEDVVQYGLTRGEKIFICTKLA
jgi:SAM-dependent methyltransferase